MLSVVIDIEREGQDDVFCGWRGGGSKYVTDAGNCMHDVRLNGKECTYGRYGSEGKGGEGEGEWLGVAC